MIGVLPKTKFTTFISVSYCIDPSGHVVCFSDIGLFVTELAGNRIMRIVGGGKDTVAKFIRQPRRESSVLRNRKGRKLG